MKDDIRKINLWVQRFPKEESCYEYLNDVLMIKNKLLITEVKWRNPSLCMLNPYKDEPHCNTLSSAINILLFYSQSWKIDSLLNSSTGLGCSLPHFLLYWPYQVSIHYCGVLHNFIIQLVHMHLHLQWLLSSLNP